MGAGQGLGLRWVERVVIQSVFIAAGVEQVSAVGQAFCWFRCQVTAPQDDLRISRLRLRE